MLNQKINEAQQIEKNLYAFYHAVIEANDLRVENNCGVDFINYPSGPWPNTVFGLPSDFNLNDISKGMLREQLPSKWILVRPENESFQTDMESCGFKKIMTWPGMAFNLKDEINSDVEDTNVSLLTKEENFEEWLEVVNQVFFRKDPLDKALLFNCWKSDSFKFYKATQEGKIVGTSLVYVNDKSIGIFLVATLKPYRRKGLAKALTENMLLDAKQMGCENAYLQASPMGAFVYEQLGFKTFCDFDIYWLLGKR